MRMRLPRGEIIQSQGQPSNTLFNRRLADSRIAEQQRMGPARRVDRVPLAWVMNDPDGRLGRGGGSLAVVVGCYPLRPGAARLPTLMTMGAQCSPARRLPARTRSSPATRAAPGCSRNRRPLDPISWARRSIAATRRRSSMRASDACWAIHGLIAISEFLHIRRTESSPS